MVIWSSTGEGLLRYTHKDKIQAVCFNPVLNTLASVSAQDFGLWGVDQQNVVKHDIPAKGLCCDWSPDGQILAIGLFNGQIILRDKNGGKLTELNKNLSPIWTLAFCPQKFDSTDNTLTVGSWDQKLALYTIAQGKTFNQVGSDKELDFDPLCISYFSDGEYMVITGTNKKVTLWNKEGVNLGQIGELRDWGWGAACKPKDHNVFVGSNAGELNMFHIEFATVHGLYHDRYAYRELMTDVIIQHLFTETRVKIRCRDYIKKIAIYKDRLAVQLPEKIIIYSVAGEDQYDMKYKAFKKIGKKIDCTLLFVLAQHLVLCIDRKVQLLNFSGVLEREWVLDSMIRYMKVIGGPPKREGLLLALKNGSVMKIFVDNAFPIPLVKQTTPIRSVDISANREKVAIVDDYNNLSVYDVKSQQMLYQEANVTSVAFNLEMEDMLAYTGNNVLYIKT